MIVKICGLTNREDALATIDLGATALGFNFYPRSPRYVADPSWIAELPSGPWRVGVFVNESPERIGEIAARAGLDIAQLHGDESPGQYPAGMRVWKAARVDAGFDLAAWQDCPAEALVLDGPAGALYGGAGVPFDWSLAVQGGCKIVLAGGLDAENVRAAIARAHPWGVDACSRIERAPGRKDYKKMAAFIQAALAEI